MNHVHISPYNTFTRSSDPVRASAYFANRSRPSGGLTKALCCLGMMLPVPVASASDVAPSAIIAGRYVAPDGSLKENVAIILADGKIQRIVRASETEGLDGVADRSDAVVCPGLVDVMSQVGAYKNAIETTHAIDPGASAVDSVDLDHRDFRAALSAGITTVAITPSYNNLVGGASVVVKTATAAEDQDSHDGRIIRREGPLLFALGSSVWEYDRAPTSRVGSLAMMREALAVAAAGSGHERLGRFVRGDYDGLVVCEEAMDVSSALRTFSGQHDNISVAYTGDVHELVEELKGACRAVVVGPYDFSMSYRTLSAASAYAADGVAIAFAGGLPSRSADSLRTTAALAVEHGLAPRPARNAMSLIPARVAGVSDRVGAIAPGLDADLVVFSGDPLRLDSRLLEVYINGKRVYHSEQRLANSHGGNP